MANTITLNQDIIQTILTRLATLQQDIAEVKEKLEAAPPYGSKEWWKWSEKRAIEDIKTGKTTLISSHEELDQFLNS